MSKYLSQLHFKYKAIQFANDFIYKCDANMIKDNEQESKILPNDKCNFCNLVTICNI